MIFRKDHDIARSDLPLSPSVPAPMDKIGKPEDPYCGVILLAAEPDEMHSSWSVGLINRSRVQSRAQAPIDTDVAIHAGIRRGGADTHQGSAQDFRL